MPHLDRESARIHARSLRRIGHHVRPYRCDVCDHWHVGHLPTAVLEGRATAAEIFT